MVVALVGDSCVHCVGRQINATGPGERSVIDIHTLEELDVAQRRKRTRHFRFLQPHTPGEPILESHKEMVVPFWCDFDDVPNHTGCGHGSGSMFAGRAFSRQSCQFRSNSSLCIIAHSWTRVHSAAICAFRLFAGAQAALVVPFPTNGRASGYNHQEGDTV